MDDLLKEAREKGSVKVTTYHWRQEVPGGIDRYWQAMKLCEQGKLRLKRSTGDRNSPIDDVVHEFVTV